jgi:hypothetical protein
MALWAGLSIDPGELRQDVLVIAARPSQGNSHLHAHSRGVRVARGKVTPAGLA